MASQPRPELPGNFRFEFDPVNRILITRMEERLTNELLEEAYRKTRKRAAVTDPLVHIMECSAVTECAVSSDFIRNMATKAPILPDPERRRFLVVPTTAAYGLARMFQMAGGSNHPHVTIVRALDEVWSALRIQPPHLEPLE
jgi:hypothetical protein